MKLMECRVTFATEPDTTYVIMVRSLEEAFMEAFELARRLRRDDWTLECNGTKFSPYAR